MSDPLTADSCSVARKTWRSGQRAAGDRTTERGITLVELLVVMAIIAFMMAVAYPNVTSGLEGIRLKSEVSDVSVFWAAARQRADRYQEVIQVTADPKKGELRAVSAESDWGQLMTLEDGLAMAEPKEPLSWMLFPGTPSPEFRILVAGELGAQAGVKVNVLTGVPEDWDGEADDE